MPSIFVSHTHGDKAIADAFATLSRVLFDDHVTVAYSSKKENEGGIGPGEEWFKWIVDQVRKTDVALILLTPGSVGKPWILWEAGAVAGAAFATSTEKARVYPITFGLKATDLPSPFANTQIINGTDFEEVVKLVTALSERFEPGLKRQDFIRFDRNKESACRTFVEDVSAALLKLPHVVTEAVIQEWLMRLDDLKESSRFSEASVIEGWIDTAFGREDDDKLRPLDVRIHRRLGDLYASSGLAPAAARQFALARRLSPRDIYVLRRLGKAYLDQKDLEASGKIIKDIIELDKKAFETNAENAALYVRWCEANGNLVGARDALERAYANLPDSYYLGDRLGQILLKLKDHGRAREIYRQVLMKVKTLREHNVWTEATRLTAAIVCEDAGDQTDALKQLEALHPTRQDLDTIERGIRGVLEALGETSTVLEELQVIGART